MPRLLMSLAILLPLLGGCAGTPPPLPDPAEMADSLPGLEADATSRPGDARAQAAYGLTLHALNRPDEAMPVLEKALALDPSMTGVVLALGGLHQDRGELDRAAAVYAAAKPGSGDDARILRAARERVEAELVAVEMKDLAAREKELPTMRSPEGSLGVMDIRSSESGDALRHLGKAVSAVMTTELSRLPGLRLVERRQLNTLLEELELAGVGASGPAAVGVAPVEETLGLQQRLAALTPGDGAAPFYQGALDGVMGESTREAIRAFQAHAGLTADGIAGPRTRSALEEAYRSAPARASSPVRAGSAPRAGQLLGARHLLGGRAYSPAEGEVAVSAQIMDAGSGVVTSELQGRHPLDEFYRLPGELVVQTADALNVELPDGERRRLLDLSPPTRNLAAFLAFGRGVESEDRGDWDGASEAYAEAARLDPGFTLARERVEVLSLGSAAFQQTVVRATSAAIRVVTATAPAVLSEAIGAVGAGTAEGDVRSENADGDRAPQADGPPTAPVRVTGRIPVGGGR